MKVTHQPKGGMCCTCANRDKDCSDLAFKTMPSISRKPQADGVVIVRCTEFVKQ